MLFKDIIGQQQVKNQLIRTVKENRVSHAQMFLGSEGRGALPLALAYAQYLSCLSKTDDDACGTCPACNKFSKIIHPDVHFIYPLSASQEKTKETEKVSISKSWRESVLANPYMNLNHWYMNIGMDNKQGQIGKTQAEEVLRDLSLKSYESEYKFMIIWMAEKMNLTAANKLLKIIEEPPPKTLFLMVVESSEDILPTIISRTQLIKVPAIGEEDLYLRLKEEFEYSDGQLKNAARLASGSYLDALEILESSESMQFNFDHFKALMRMSYSRHFQELFSWSETLSTQGREKIKNFLTYSLRMIRENFMENLGNNSITYLSEQEQDFSDKFNPFVNIRNASLMADEFAKATYDVERNGNAKIILLDLSLKITKLIKR